MGHQSPETNSKSYASELRVSNCHYVPAPRGLHPATCFWQFRPLWWNWWTGETFQKHTNQIGNKTPFSYVWHRSMFSETEERRRCGFALFGGGNLSGAHVVLTVGSHQVVDPSVTDPLSPCTLHTPPVLNHLHICVTLIQSPCPLLVGWSITYFTKYNAHSIFRGQLLKCIMYMHDENIKHCFDVCGEIWTYMRSRGLQAQILNWLISLSFGGDWCHVWGWSQSPLAWQYLMCCELCWVKICKTPSLESPRNFPKLWKWPQLVSDTYYLIFYISIIDYNSYDMSRHQMFFGYTSDLLPKSKTVSNAV